MMDTYGRFKLMQALRAYLLIAVPGMEENSYANNNSPFFDVIELSMSTGITIHRFPPNNYFGEVTYYDADISNTWFMKANSVSQSSYVLTVQYDDYKNFVAYMRGEL